MSSEIYEKLNLILENTELKLIYTENRLFLEANHMFLSNKCRGIKSALWSRSKK